MILCVNKKQRRDRGKQKKKSDGKKEMKRKIKQFR